MPDVRACPRCKIIVHKERRDNFDVICDFCGASLIQTPYVFFIRPLVFIGSLGVSIYICTYLLSNQSVDIQLLCGGCAGLILWEYLESNILWHLGCRAFEERYKR